MKVSMAAVPTATALPGRVIDSEASNSAPPMDMFLVIPEKRLPVAEIIKLH